MFAVVELPVSMERAVKKTETQKAHGCVLLPVLASPESENKGGRTKEKREDAQLRPNQLLLLVWGAGPAFPSCKMTPVQTQTAV